MRGHGAAVWDYPYRVYLTAIEVLNSNGNA